MGFSRSGKNIEATHLKRSIDDSRREADRLQGLGEQFERDKEKIETQIKKIETSPIKREDKIRILNELKVLLEKLKEQYDEEVDKKNEEVVVEFKEKEETAKEQMEEFQETIESIESVEMEAADFESQKAINAARDKKAEFERMKEDASQALKQKVESMERQRRIMQRRNFSS